MRDAEEIVPNIHMSAQTTRPPGLTSASARREDADVANEVGVSPFTRMSIFDSPAVNLRVDENLSYVYTPAEISLFGTSTAGIRAVQELGSRSVREMTPTTNPFLRYFQRGTAIYQHIEALGSATDLPALEALSVLATQCRRERTPRTRSRSAEVERGRGNADARIVKWCEPSNCSSTIAAGRRRL